MMQHLLRRGGGTARSTSRASATRPATTPAARGSGARRARGSRRRDDKWICACLHEWNTFETGGVCPACQRQWLETQCPRCDTWSPHLAWYVDDADAGPS